MPLNLKIVDKKRQIFEGAVDFCEIPTEAGIEGVMPEHINFISNMVSGKIKYKIGEKAGEIDASEGGFVEISRNNVNILLNNLPKLPIENFNSG
jgi:F0F1-type ATP synthase epsilon subunit